MELAPSDYETVKARWGHSLTGDKTMRIEKKFVNIRKFVMATAALGFIAFAVPANATASLAGDTIHAYYIYPTSGSVLNDLGTFTAPGGGHIYVESYSVSGNQVIITADPSGTSWVVATYNGLQFVDQSANPGITGLFLDPASNANGVSASDASFTSNSMSFNFAGQSWGAGQSAIFDIGFGSAGPVPEPATWAMMLLGFGMAGFGLRSRRKAPVSVTYA